MYSIIPQNGKKSGYRAQSAVEFALVAPILFVMLIGIIEVSRMVFIYASVTNASREAVRFGSAIGFNDTTYNRKYQYCSEIRATAKRTSFLVSVPDSNIVIQYDHGPGTTVFDTCPVGTDTDPTIVVKTGQDRVTVTVTASYAPLTKLLPIGSRDISASSSRTILGFVEVGP